MVDRRRIAQQAKLAIAHQALKVQAEQDLLDATRQEAQRRVEMRAARLKAEEAAGEWSAYLAGGAIDPAFLAHMAADVTQKDVTQRSANEAVARAAEVSLHRQRTLATCDVQATQAEAILHRLRHEAASDADEAASATFQELIAWRVLAS